MHGKEIREICGEHYHTSSLFYDVCSADTLPREEIHSPFFIIANTDYSFGNGKHWVLIFLQDLNTSPIWFDPLGQSPEKYKPEFLLYLSNYFKAYRRNTRTYQASDSNRCGEFCLYMADMLSVGHSFQTAVQTLHPRKLWQNDICVVQYVYGHMIS